MKKVWTTSLYLVGSLDFNLRWTSVFSVDTSSAKINVILVPSKISIYGKYRFSENINCPKISILRKLYSHLDKSHRNQFDHMLSK